MPIITVKLQTPVRRTFRVEQIAGMFDVPLEERVRHELVAEVPGVEEKWTIGAIVGPSGSGKTTLAKAAFGGIYERRAWPKDRAIIDCFPDVPIKELTVALASAGLGSPPTWLKPYHVLSGGEKYRADLFRALVRSRGVVVVDEFSALLDRTVAKTASAAFARLVRWLSDSPEPLWFVAVTCHRDILPWLSPDWVVELGRSDGGTERKRDRETYKSSLRPSVAPSLSPNTRLIRGRPRRPGFRFVVD